MTNPDDKSKNDKLEVESYRLMSSNAEALAAIAALIARLERELCIFDVSPAVLRSRDFNRPERVEQLQHFLAAHTGNRLRIVLQDDAQAGSELPRLVALLRQRPQQVQIHRAIGEARRIQDVLMLVDDCHFWRKPHFEHPRSVLQLDDAEAARPFVERFAEIWISSEPAITATTLGL